MPPEEHFNDASENTTGSVGKATITSEDTSGQQKSFITTDDAMRERMLDIFPVSAEELETILRGYSQFVHGSATFSSFHCSESVDRRLQQIEDTILSEWSNSLIQAALDNVFLIGTGHDDDDQFKFIEAISCLLGRRGARSLLQIIHSAAAIKASCVVPQPETLACLVHRLVVASCALENSEQQQQQVPLLLRPTPKSWIDSLLEHAHATETKGVTLAMWTDWVNSIAPQVYQALSTLALYAIFPPDHPFRPGSHPLLFPKMQHKSESALWKYNHQTVPSSLALLSPNFGRDWTSLYSSDLDGFSFVTFQRALLSYQGATVILLQSEQAGEVFGFYTDCPWKESRHWYGQDSSSESFLFCLKPTLRFYGPTGDKRFYMYLNNPLSPRPGDLTGLAIGGISDKTPRLHIPPSLEQCKAGSMDGAYESGPMLSDGNVFFNIDLMEVWAISSNQDEFINALRAGRALADTREGIRIKAATVDRKQFLDDFQSGQYINSLYAHREQSRGRHSFCADEEGKGYFIEEKEPTSHGS